MVACLVALDRAPAATPRGLPTFDPTQPNTPARSLYRQRVFRHADGLPSDTILALHLGRDRSLWIGTPAGLVRYDGHQFRVFDHVDHPDFTSDVVNAIAEGLDGALWVGTNDGLLEFRDGRVYRRYGPAEGLADPAVRTLCVRRNGEVWFTTESATHRVLGVRVTAWTDLFPPMATGPAVRRMFEDASGVLHVMGAQGPVQRWVDGTHTWEPLIIPGLPEGANGMVEDGQGRLWIANVPSAYRDEHRWHAVEAGHPLAKNTGMLDLADRHGTLWLNDWDNGILAYHAGRLRRFTHADGLSTTPVLAMVEDHEGALWLGTESGLNRWLPRRFPTLDAGNGLSDDGVWTFAEEPDGTVWIGTDFGVSRRRPDGRVDHPIATLASHRVRSLHVDGAGTLWIGTGDSLESWRAGHQTRHRWEEENSLNKVRVVTSDRSGRIWVGRQRGLMRFEHGAWTRYTVADGLPNDDVRALREDRLGRLWIGTFGGGLAVAEVAGAGGSGTSATSTPGQGSFVVRTRLGKADGLPSDYVWAFHEDSEGFVWAGTERGLARVAALAERPPSVQGVVGRSAGLHHEAVNEILEDDAGWFWLSSDHGIARVRRTELHAVAEGKSGTVASIVYGEADGLWSDETNGQKSQPAGLKARDGRLWFPTTHGAVVVDPRTIDALETPCTVGIERVVADGEVLYEHGPGTAPDSGRGFRRGPGRVKVLEVKFDAVSFREPRDVRFRYRLAGFDTNWTEPGPRQVAFYTNLEPGRYRFEVQAAVNHARWSVRSAGFELEVFPRFYQTTGFRIALVFAIGGLGFALVRWRERGRERLDALRRQLALAEERQRIARDMHDDLGAGLTRLVLLGEHGRREAPPGAASVLPVLEGVGREATRLVDHLGELVWATNPEFDELGSLLARLREHAAGFLADAGLAGRLEFPDWTAQTARRVAGAVRKNLVLAFKETLTNAVRHAGARRVDVDCRLEPAALELVVSDDGQGFAVPDADALERPGGTNGNGLRNMRMRLERVGGTCEVRSIPGEGTRVVLRVPLAQAGP
jgi:ligand-binding sensor domain-containing protein/signal transduction histidine kinase